MWNNLAKNKKKLSYYSGLAVHFSFINLLRLLIFSLVFH